MTRCLSQSVIKVPGQIFDVFQPDGNSNQIAGDSVFAPLFLANHVVAHSLGERDQSMDAAQTHRRKSHLEVLHNRGGRAFGGIFQVNGHHSRMSTAVLGLCHFVRRMRMQKRVDHFFDGRMMWQEFRQRQSIRMMLFHANLRREKI